MDSFKHLRSLIPLLPPISDASIAEDSDTESGIRLGMDLDTLYVARPSNSRDDGTGEATPKAVLAAPSDPDDPGRPPLWGSMITTAEDDSGPKRLDSQREDKARTQETSSFDETIRSQVQSEQKKRQERDNSAYKIRPCAEVQYNLVKKWFCECDTSHKCRTETKPSLEMSVMAVDCIEMRLVPIETTEKYFALSYVWGDVPALELTREKFKFFCTPASFDRVSRSLSQTVVDAIRFVREAGGRYLWVDRLCIVQDDDEGKRRAIQNMDVVYRSAWAVIIAGAGANADAGLAGVGKTSTRSIPCGTGTKSKIPEEVLAGTIYETRAWT